MCSELTHSRQGGQQAGAVFASPTRTTPWRHVAKLEIPRFPRTELSCMPGSMTTQGRAATRSIAAVRIAFRQWDSVGALIVLLSRLNGWPARSPVNASPTSSRGPAHDSGPMRLATSSSRWTCTTYSLPVSRRTPPLRIQQSQKSQAPYPPLQQGSAHRKVGIFRHQQASRRTFSCYRRLGPWPNGSRKSPLRGWPVRGLFTPRTAAHS